MIDEVKKLLVEDVVRCFHDNQSLPLVLHHVEVVVGIEKSGVGREFDLELAEIVELVGSQHGVIAEPGSVAYKQI